MNKTSVFGAVLAAGGLLLAPVAANAELLAYEGFDYNEGDLSGQNGGTGWGGAWEAGSVVGGSLGYTDAHGNSLATTGNHGFFDASSGSLSTYRTLAQAAGQGTYWMSFVGVRLAPHSGDDNYIRAASVQLHNNGGGDERVSVGKGTTASPVETNWGVFYDGDFNTADYSDTLMSEQVFAVLRIDINDDVDDVDNPSDDAYLWINPNLDEPLGAADAELLGAFDYTFDSMRIFVGGTNGDGEYAQLEVDEIRIGTTAGDVGIVPEPASLSLLGATGLFMLRRRRIA